MRNGSCCTGLKLRVVCTALKNAYKRLSTVVVKIYVAHGKKYAGNVFTDYVKTLVSALPYRTVAQWDKAFRAGRNQTVELSRTVCVARSYLTSDKGGESSPCNRPFIDYPEIALRINKCDYIQITIGLDSLFRYRFYETFLFIQILDFVLSTSILNSVFSVYVNLKRKKPDRWKWVS
ncbi:hypothetical protein Avbf_12058 [Armadillidium vulgare]|nr:hypothetical protein Avbf_12058 [Armadillidium vulgare]